VSPTLRLGRIFGIEIGFNWSLLFVFALIAWSLATALPRDVPGRPVYEYWAAGLAGALVFYLCLLAHELAHALMAREQGVKVGGITLWLFGGVSRLESEPKSAAAEAAITVVGPLASLVIACLCYGLAIPFSIAGGPPLVTDLLFWLALINLTLGLFNLVPAFPLDGGRLLSSLLWWRGGSRRRGVHQAVRVGRLFAYAMVGLGFAELFFGSVLNGAWLVFLGWFLLSAAGAEERGAEVHELLESLPVSAAMSSPVVTVPDWLSVEDFLSGVAPSHPFTTYPLHDPAGSLTGVVRLSELLPPRGGALRDHASKPADLPRARADEDLNAMLERVGPELRRRVLVYDGDRLVGIVSPADVARVLAVRQAAGKK
jgi:Zn-dependent protease